MIELVCCQGWGKRLRDIMLLAVLLLLSALVHRASASVGLPFLRLSPGARGAALAEAVAALRDVEAAAANPAALQALNQRSIGLAHSFWIQGIHYDYLSLAINTGQSTWGLAAQVSQADGLERRTGPTGEPQGVFGVYDGALSLTWAHAWTARLRLGGSVKILRQVVATRTANGAGFDGGILYDLGDRFHLGLAVCHLGRMGALNRQAAHLPSTLRLGMAYTGWPRWLISGEAQRGRGRATTLHLGIERAVDQRLTVRGGYHYADTRGLTAGLGLAINNWTLDYAFLPIGSGLGEAHRFSVQLHR